MASIPQYNAPQVQAQALPAVRQQSIASPAVFAKPDYLGALGQGLEGVGAVVAKRTEELQLKDDTATGTRLGAEWLNKITDYKIEVRNRKGELAKGLPAEADKFFNDLTKQTIDNAPNERVKQYLQTYAMQHQPGFYTYVGNHAAEQLDKAEQLGLEARIASLKNAAAADPALAAINAKEVGATVRLQLNKQGVTDPDAIALATLEQTSALHKGVIDTLMVQNPKAALAYFGVNKDGILPAIQNKYAEQLKNINDANDALEGADRIWQGLGPKGDGSPVQLDVMEAEVRKMFDGDPSKIKATVDELRSRASAFNSSERERSAANSSAVLGAFLKGASMAQLQRMPEFQRLSREGQNEILVHVDNKLYQEEARAAARESRAAARESRANTAAERADREAQKKNFIAYMGVYSKPEVIAGMSENAIISMTPQLGESIVFSMLKQRREMASKPEKVYEAQIKVNDFNQIAQSVGLNPYDKNTDKAALGELKFRVDNIIEAEQTRIGKPLDRAAVQAITRQEAARTVTVDKGIFSFEKQVPVISLPESQIDTVKLNRQERETALARLKKLHDLYPSDPRYTATETNLKRVHLQSISKAAP